MPGALHHWMMLAAAVFLVAGSGKVYGAGTRGVVLSWNPPNATNTIVQYHIYYGTQSGLYTNILTTDGSVAAGYVLQNLPGDHTYYFKVSATDNNGNNSGLSDEASVALPNPKPVKLEMQVYADDSNAPYLMTISGTNTTTTDWELDSSTDLLNWTYVTGDHGINIYWEAYFADANRIFFRVVDH
ncbi:MAG TPA: fibronectin type III domain-containing protein [Verrucomicrobiae bacterium]|nr:fibronectin type III domain-containing protein [Verrucomicrobiae bacterium]